MPTVLKRIFFPVICTAPTLARSKSAFAAPRGHFMAASSPAKALASAVESEAAAAAKAKRRKAPLHAPATAIFQSSNQPLEE